MMGSRSTPVLASARSTSSRRSRMSEARRERLRDIQRRALLQDSLKDGLMRSYGKNFPDEGHARRVIADEVGKVVAEPVISHIDIQNMEKKVAQRSKLTGRGRRASAMRASARRTAGSRVIGSAKYTPRVLPKQGAAAAGNARQSQSVAKLRLPKRSADGVPRVAQPETTALDGLQDEDLARRVEQDKWKHTSATSYGAFVDGLEILPKKPSRIGQEDRATVEWNLLTEYELEQAKTREEREALQRKKERAKNQAFLQKQAEDKRRRREQERQEQLAWDRKKMEELQELERKEAEQAAARRRKELADRKVYEQALSVAIKAKEDQAKLDAMSDKAYALSAAKAVEEEKLAEEKRITDAKKKYKLFLQANEVERAKKEKLAEKEAEDDYQRMLAYMELMDKQQAAREAYFAEFREKTKRKFEMSLDTHSKAQALEEWTNKRAEEGRRKAEEERRRKEEAAAARKQANKAETLRVLEQQIKEKQETRRKLRAAAIAERQATERRIRDAKKAESEEKRRAREKNLQYKKELEAQIKIRAKELPDPYFHMNNTERMMNYNRLIKAKELATQRSSARVSKPAVEPFSARRSRR